MIKKGMLLLILTAVFLILPGCWSKYELTERGFVMGVALDQGKNGDIEMLTQIYRPTSAQSVSSATTGPSSIHIKTTDQSVMEAIRDIPIHLGRKAQWSHLRVIIVGEKLARKVNVGNLLDLFYRDHEPRSSVSLMIAKGSASKLLMKQPLIEQTSAQQFLRASESAYNTASKTMDISLLHLLLQLKSANSDAVVSYVYEEKQSNDMFAAAGLALLKDGKMKVILPSKRVEGLLVLRNAYKSGVIEISCPGRKGENETSEILAMQVRVKPVFKGDKLTIRSKIEGDIAIGELSCSTISSLKDEEAFIKRVEEKLKEQVRLTIKFLQANQIDVIDVGNHVYRTNPRKWERMKGDWGKQFAEASFDVQAKLRLVTNGTISSKPAN